jgi:hypothetical protein
VGGDAPRVCFLTTEVSIVVLVKADYSQVELRLAAKMSGDKALRVAYQRGEDLHTLTARKVLGIDDVSKEHRQLAKALNFGLLYGMGAKGLRVYARSNYGVDLTEEKAAPSPDGTCFRTAQVGTGAWTSNSVAIEEPTSRRAPRQTDTPLADRDHT